MCGCTQVAHFDYDGDGSIDLGEFLVVMKQAARSRAATVVQEENAEEVQFAWDKKDAQFYVDKAVKAQASLEVRGPT